MQIFFRSYNNRRCCVIFSHVYSTIRGLCIRKIFCFSFLLSRPQRSFSGLGQIFVNKIFFLFMFCNGKSFSSILFTTTRLLQISFRKFRLIYRAMIPGGSPHEEETEALLFWTNPHSLRSWPFSKFYGWRLTSSHVNLRSKILHFFAKIT